MTDELADRIRSLEAERLRPVPGWHQTPNLEDLDARERREFSHRIDAFLGRLDHFGRRHHPDHEHSTGDKN